MHVCVYVLGFEISLNCSSGGGVGLCMCAVRKDAAAERRLLSAVFYAKWAVKSQFYAPAFCGNWDNLNKMRRRPLYDLCVRAWQTLPHQTCWSILIARSIKLDAASVIFMEIHRRGREKAHILSLFFFRKVLCVHELVLCVQIGIIKKGTRENICLRPAD